MKKPELVALAEQHGLKKTGTKDDLIQRIVEALPRLRPRLTSPTTRPF